MRIGTTGQVRLLRHLTHIAFDYQIGRKSGYGRMGIGVWGVGNFVGIVHEVLAAGRSPALPSLLDGGGSLSPHAEDGEGEGNVQGSGSGAGAGVGQGEGEGANGAGGDGTLDADMDTLDYLDELGKEPPLEHIIVKIILRPHDQAVYMTKYPNSGMWEGMPFNPLLKQVPVLMLHTS